MNEKRLFAGFSEEEEKYYEQEARQIWGEKEVSASYKRWNNYSAQEKKDIKSEGQVIYSELASMIESDPSSPEVQEIIGRWHQHLHHFYEPSVSRLRGLGQLYVDNPDFAQFFRELHPDLPEFMRGAIEIYCQNLD